MFDNFVRLDTSSVHGHKRDMYAYNGNKVIWFTKKRLSNKCIIYELSHEVFAVDSELGVNQCCLVHYDVTGYKHFTPYDEIREEDFNVDSLVLKSQDFPYIYFDLDGNVLPLEYTSNYRLMEEPLSGESIYDDMLCILDNSDLVYDFTISTVDYNGEEMDRRVIDEISFEIPAHTLLYIWGSGYKYSQPLQNIQTLLDFSEDTNGLYSKIFGDEFSRLFKIYRGLT